jgi:diguanylate cyclase (GGDEF)-like protein/PAS domain S-box-containing protein
MLQDIAEDLAWPQTEKQEIAKSTGQNDSNHTAATEHGKERLVLGFSLDAALAEYRALRASVIRSWQKALIDQPLSAIAMADLIRFNEAIDQLINESATSYSLEKELQKRAFDAILSSLPNISFIVTLEGRLSYANKAATEFFALPAEQLVGKNFVDLGLANATELQQQIDAVISSKEQLNGEMSHARRGGQTEYYDYLFVPSFDAKGMVDAVAGMAHNITERKRREDQNWNKANYDSLTGLPNRQLFIDRIEQEIKHAERAGTRTALFFIDLDHFKAANDQFGHETGDILLRLVADRLRACIRESDTVARLGGDEFTVVMQDLADPQEVELVAGKILTELANPFQILNNTVRISASIGLTVAPQDARKSADLIRNADKAMYTAKTAGGNQFIFFAQSPGESIGAQLQKQDERRRYQRRCRDFRH